MGDNVIACKLRCVAYVCLLAKHLINLWTDLKEALKVFIRCTSIMGSFWSPVQDGLPIKQILANTKMAMTRLILQLYT